mgnify:FL=1
MTEVEKMVAAYLASGGKVTVCKPGTPKDLKRMRYTGWLFGGRRCYVASVHRRSESAKGEMFMRDMAKPMTNNKKLAYDFA